MILLLETFMKLVKLIYLCSLQIKNLTLQSSHLTIFLYLMTIIQPIFFPSAHLRTNFFISSPSSFNISLFRFALSSWNTSTFVDSYAGSSLSWHDWVWSDLFFLTTFPTWYHSSNWKFTFSKIWGFSRGPSWILWSNWWMSRTILLGKLYIKQKVLIFPCTC